MDIIVNNAGGSPPHEAATASSRFAEAVVRLNMLGPLYMAQAAYPHMVKAKYGCIVNIASVSGARPSPETAIYGAPCRMYMITLTILKSISKDKEKVLEAEESRRPN
jgi:NADP-dependent 3-hydroxy acid dehydrogenase YdfG